ncbi:nitroreductase family protein, partial [Candidatus Woesearchaeota archaeon]|nr:nitroreductase family protein [Candidatus Woesearchaeota archaeon]
AMDVNEAVKKRRSIRRYDEQRKISLDTVGELIDTARFTPSAGNLQNWKIVVVSDEKIKEELAISCVKQMWMATAPIILVICNDLEEIRTLYSKRGETLYSIQNCANIAMTLMLLAKENGLDTCWVGAFDKDAVQRLLGIPDGVEPEIILTLGYGFETKIYHPRRREVSHFCFFEKWGKKEKK